MSGIGKINGVSINLSLEMTFGLHDTVLETGKDRFASHQREGVHVLFPITWIS